MRRAVTLGGGLLAGGVVGALLMLGVQGLSPGQPPPAVDTTVVPTAGFAGSEPTTMAPTPEPGSGFNPPPISDQVLLVWTPGGLPDGFADRVARLPGVTAVTAVRSDLVHMAESLDANGEVVDRPQEGFVIPLEVIAFDPESYPALVSKKDGEVFATISPGEIILGSTSAEIRRLGPGGVVILEDGTRLTVAAVVDDVLIGAAEAALPTGQADAIGVSVERYLLVRYSGTRKAIESSVRSELPDGVTVRIRAPGETPVLRHGDAVLPPILIKQRFGEFAYRPSDGLAFDIEPGWVKANIVTAEIPLLGRVTCHRNLLPALAGAMEELEQRGLAHLIDPDQFRGCFHPRYIAGRKGISRHAWGVAIDINSNSNPAGLESTQDLRLLEVMERWGFTSGHDWLVPDPGHFEYLRPPRHG